MTLFNIPKDTIVVLSFLEKKNVLMLSKLVTLVAMQSHTLVFDGLYYRMKPLLMSLCSSVTETGSPVFEYFVIWYGPTSLL